jgi:hypothetical protein
MKAQGSGKIINVGSRFSLFGGKFLSTYDDNVEKCQDRPFAPTAFRARTNLAHARNETHVQAHADQRMIG